MKINLLHSTCGTTVQGSLSFTDIDDLKQKLNLMGIYLLTLIPKNMCRARAGDPGCLVKDLSYGFIKDGRRYKALSVDSFRTRALVEHPEWLEVEWVKERYSPK